jgi:parvulin-like peptidyl-prolyl isomerase
MLIIVQNDEQKVKEALAQLARGEDEKKVIKEFSIDPRTLAKDGRTGLVPRGTFAPQIEDVAFSGIAGKGWKGPVVATTGVAAIKVLEQQDSRRATFEEVKDEITRQMATGRGESAFETWLQEQRKQRGVEIFDETLELYGQPIS